jgi:hypothetical protein
MHACIYSQRQYLLSADALQYCAKRWEFSSQDKNSSLPSWSSQSGICGEDKYRRNVHMQQKVEMEDAVRL